MLSAWRLTTKIDPILKNTYRKIVSLPVPNLKGDRDVEYSWIADHLPAGPGEALEFGCGDSWMGLLAARKGFSVTAVDLTQVSELYTHPRLMFVKDDIFKMDLAADRFDVIINCSSIEHVGLAGRYDIAEMRPEGDIEAMGILKRALKPGKNMLLTIPVGRDKVFPPLVRIYGRERLPRLLEGWRIVEHEYWVKDRQNLWNCVPEAVALDREPLDYCHGLGLFVLTKECAVS